MGSAPPQCNAYVHLMCKTFTKKSSFDIESLTPGSSNVTKQEIQDQKCKYDQR